MKKSIWVMVLVAILTAAIAVSVVYAVQYVQKNKGVLGDKHNTSYSIEYLQSEYEQGDDIVYHFVVYSDVDFTAITYKLGTADEAAIEHVKTGKSADLENVPEKVGEFYADTKVQVINSSDLREGYYSITFYGYDKDNNRYEINKDPYTFKLVVVEAETPATETPATETPATETPAAETPATETPATETPAAETPAAETPATETPMTQIPVTE